MVRRNSSFPSMACLTYTFSYCYNILHDNKISMQYFHEENDFLIANFEFKNFLEALAFVNEIATISEKIGHHPNIMLHNYRFVEVSTTTHDA